jgi:hypothetical protein
MKANIQLKKTISLSIAAVLFALGSSAAVAGTWNPTSSDANSNTAGGSNALGSIAGGASNTAFAYGALYKNTTGYMNSAFGVYALLNNSTGYGNTAMGMQTLQSNTTGAYNSGYGTYALYGNTIGTHNVAMGHKSQMNATSANYNTSVGNATLQANTSGTNNTAIGYQAGTNQTTGSYNIYVNHTGVAAESKTTRIGDVQTSAYLAGVYAQSTSDAATSLTVYVDKNGKLGTLMSSQRYKENIRDMGESSQRLYQLRPVTYNYKQDDSKTLEYGLIAEEVAKVYPDLVVHGKDGQVETVQYHKLVPMLLNEILRLRDDVEKMKAKSGN